jgi:transcription-repair coupling factor (superfamily II helicase)
VPDETDRLALYRRLARAESAAELAELRDEMCDRFGPVPPLVENLIAVMNLRRLMREMMVVGAIRKGGDEIEIRFHPDAPVDPGRLAALVGRNRRLMRLAPPCQVVVKLTGGVEPAQMFDWLGGILQALRSCETLEGQTAGLTGELLN